MQKLNQNKYARFFSMLLAMLLVLSYSGGSITAMASSATVRLEVEAEEILTAMERDRAATDTYEAAAGGETGGDDPTTAPATFQLDRGAGEFLRGLSLPYEQEGSSLARRQMMQALEGKALVKTFRTGGIEALVTVDTVTGKLEVVALNTRDHQIFAELVVTDQQGQKLDAGQVDALIHRITKEDLTEGELEQYRQSDSTTVEVLEVLAITAPTRQAADVASIIEQPAQEQENVPDKEPVQSGEQRDDEDSMAHIGEDQGEPLPDAGEAEDQNSGGLVQLRVGGNPSPREADDSLTTEPQENTDPVEMLFTAVVDRQSGGAVSGEDGILSLRLPARAWATLTTDRSFVSDALAGEAIVTFDPQNGEDPWHITVAVGSALSDPGRPDGPAGETNFLGWYDSDAGEAYNFASPVMDDLMLYGNWRSASFQVTYDLGDGAGETPVDPNLYALGEHARVLPPPDAITPPDGMQFVGWQEQGGGPVHYPYGRLLVSGPVTLEAKYADLYDVCMLMYYSNGGDGMSIMITAQMGEEIPLLGQDAFTRHGFHLIGWSQDPEAVTAEYQPNSAIVPEEHHTVLYAIWEPRKYTVAFVAQSGGSLTGETSFVLEYGTPLSEIAIPTAVADEDHYFMGWNPYPDRYDHVTGDLVYTAIFGKQETATVVAASAMYSYDGTTRRIDGYTTDLPVGYTIIGLTAEGEGVDAGAYPVSLHVDKAQYAILDDWGMPVTERYGELKLENGILKITPAPLTVKANDMTISAGSPVPDYPLEYSGFVGDEGPEVLEAAPSVHCDYTPDSPAGSYPITLFGVRAANYTINYVDGALTVTGGDEGGSSGGGDEGGSSGGSSGDGGQSERIPGDTILPDSQIPLSLTTIQEEETPLQEVFTIYDNPVPVGDLPSAGGIPVELVIPLGALLACAGGVCKLGARRKTQRGDKPETDCGIE